MEDVGVTVECEFSTGQIRVPVGGVTARVLLDKRVQDLWDEKDDKNRKLCRTSNDMKCVGAYCDEGNEGKRKR